MSGGTRWGGGVWINAMDMARFGYLWLRNGRWGNKQIIPPAYVKTALTPSAHGPDYGFLWWLNTTRRREDAADQLVPGPGRRQQHHLRLAGSRPGDRGSLAALPAGSSSGR